MSGLQRPAAVPQTPAQNRHAAANASLLAQSAEITRMHDNDQDDPLPQNEFFSSFELDKAWDDVKTEFRQGTVTTKATATAKLLGKSLWNAGLHIAKNAPAYIEKAKAGLEKDAEDQEKKKLVFERKSNSDLVDIAKNGSNDIERRIAFNILKTRKAEHDAQKNI
jgi:hypothetical protein